MTTSLDLITKKMQTMNKEELKLLLNEILDMTQPELKTYWVLKTDSGYLQYDANLDYGIITGNINLATEFAESMNLNLLKMMTENYANHVLKCKTTQWISIKKIQT